MPEMLCHRHLGGIDFPRSRGLYCAISGIKGNTAASIAMTASAGAAPSRTSRTHRSHPVAASAFYPPIAIIKKWLVSVGIRSAAPRPQDGDDDSVIMPVDLGGVIWTPFQNATLPIFKQPPWASDRRESQTERNARTLRSVPSPPLHNKISNGSLAGNCCFVSARGL
jgi:hypothetical protein